MIKNYLKSTDGFCSVLLNEYLLVVLRGFVAENKNKKRVMKLLWVFFVDFSLYISVLLFIDFNLFC